MITLACIQLLKPAIGQKGDQRPLRSRIHDVKCRSYADTDRHLVILEPGCVYIAGLCAKLPSYVEGLILQISASPMIHHYLRNVCLTHESSRPQDGAIHVHPCVFMTLKGAMDFLQTFAWHPWAIASSGKGHSRPTDVRTSPMNHHHPKMGS